MQFFDTGSDDFGIDPSIQGRSTVSYINEAGVPEEVAREAIRKSDIAGALDKWMQQVSGNQQGQIGNDSSLFFRNRYELTDNIFDQMLQCSDAVEYDEILSNLCDVTESLAFNKMSFEAIDSDQEDVWNQIAGDLDMDSRLREIWRELFKVSQCYVAIEWGQKTYTVRTPPTDLMGKSTTPMSPEMVQQQNKMKALSGQTPDTFNAPEEFDPEAQQEELGPDGKPKQKRKRRKQFNLWVPRAISILDPTKVIPVGQLMFGKERFAYVASKDEDTVFHDVFSGKIVDPMVLNLIEGPYKATKQEESVLGVNTSTQEAPRLWLFKKDCVFRHTLTRAQYERFASVRLKSVLPILEMKSHLRASDRATLIGSTNFIVVLKRGTDKWPARPGELEQLRDQARIVARMPILVGDHRLSVEIVTPDNEHTLDSSRYGTLDESIIMRALGTFRPGGRTAGQSSTAETDHAVVARGIESRRHEIKRTLEEHLIQATMEKNVGVLTEKPALSFHPKRVHLAWDANVINAVLKLRDRGDISRQTSLEELDFDQDTEFVRRRREKDKYDSAFKSSVPFSSPAANPFAPGVPGSPTAPGGPPGPDGQGSTTNGRPPGATNQPGVSL